MLWLGPVAVVLLLLVVRVRLHRMLVVLVVMLLLVMVLHTSRDGRMLMRVAAQQLLRLQLVRWPGHGGRRKLAAQVVLQLGG